MPEDEDKDLIDRSGHDFPMLALIVAITIALAAVGIGFGLVRRGEDSPKRTLTPGTQGRTEVMSGRGPFVLFAATDESGHPRAENQWIIAAADLSTVVEDQARGIDATRYDVGQVNGVIASPVRQASVGSVVPLFVRDPQGVIPVTSGWLLRRDRLFGRPQINVRSAIDAVASSPDGTRVGAFVPGGTADKVTARWCVWTISGATQTCGPDLGEGPVSPESAPLPIAWLKASDEIVEFPFCACDYWAPPALYALKTTGRPRELSWFGTPHSSTYASSADGTVLVHEDERSRQCSGVNPCVEGPLLLTLTNLTTRKTRTLARTNELRFTEPVVSAGGNHIAYASGLAGEVVMVDALGRRETSFDYPAYEVHPLAFIGDTTLLYAAVDPDPRDSSHADVRILRVRLEDGKWSQPAIVATGRDLQYLGWLR